MSDNNDWRGENNQDWGQEEDWGNYNNPNNTNVPQETDNDGESRGFSLKTSGIILAAIVFVIVIGLITLRGCTVKEKGNETGADNTVQSSTSQDYNENTQSQTQTKEPSKSLVTPDEEDVVKDEGDVSLNSDNGDGTAFREVEVPQLGETYQTDTIVSGKKAYLLDGVQYIYSVGLIFPSNDSYTVIDYFCSKKIFDEIKSGETVKATYQLDENGILSVTSISR